MTLFEKPNSLQVIGLAMEGHSLQAVQLAQVKGQPVLKKLYHLNWDEDVKQLYTQEEYTSLQAHARQDLSITTLNSEQVLVRTLDIKLKKDKDIDAVLSFQTEPLLPYPIENALIDRIKTSEGTDGSQLSVLAVRKEQMQEHLAGWNEQQIDPEVVSCEPVALAAFSKQFCTSLQPHFVVHLGNTHTTCILVKEGKLIAMQSGHWGLNALKQIVSEPLSIDYLSISPKQQHELHEAVHSWRLEISRLLHALSKARKGQETTECLFTGPGAACSNLSAALSEGLNKSVLMLEKGSIDMTIPELQAYAIPLGAALTALPGHQETINFRQKEYAYAQPWKRFKMPLVAYFAACIGLAISLFLFGKVYTGYQEDQLRQEYVNLLASTHRGYDTFEKEYLTKQLKQPEAPIQSIQQLSKEEIDARLYYLQKELKSHPDTFALLPNVPRVSELLGWLSTHSIAAPKDQPSAMQIDNITYTMVKRPEPKKPQDKYQVKVELEFSTQTPKLAREFHDSLIAPNDFVDPKGEVKWSSNKGKYRASFFLKDKTAYSTRLEG